MGIPPSARPCRASSIAAARNGSDILSSTSFLRPPILRHSASTGRQPEVNRSHGGTDLALVFLVIGFIAALLGFTSIAGASFAIAKFLAGVFLILFLVFLLLALGAARRIVD